MGNVPMIVMIASLIFRSTIFPWLVSVSRQALQHYPAVPFKLDQSAAYFARSIFGVVTITRSMRLATMTALRAFVHIKNWRAVHTVYPYASEVDAALTKACLLPIVQAANNTSSVAYLDGGEDLPSVPAL
jgi:hypothetical protein